MPSASQAAWLRPALEAHVASHINGLSSRSEKLCVCVCEEKPWKVENYRKTESRKIAKPRTVGQTQKNDKSKRNDKQKVQQTAKNLKV